MSDLDSIVSFIEENINSALSEHKGRCEVFKYENNILSLKLVSGCTGCPSSRLTMYEFIAPTLQEYFPGIEVELV